MGSQEFDAFKWHLLQPVNLEGLWPIPKSQLEGATRIRTVDLIRQRYHSKTVQIVVNVLKKMPRNDLVRRLTNESEGR